MRVSRREALAGGLALLPSLALAQERAPPLSFAVEVPIDHDRPQLGRFPLGCEPEAAFC